MNLISIFLFYKERQKLFQEEMEEIDFSKKLGLYHSTIEAMEKSLIERTLERTFGNQLKAAALLDINRNTLRNKIKKLGIEVKRWKL